jgi:penicillin-binding protein-related factor A (putative recombinase)
MLEKDIEKLIMDWLRLFPHCKVWKNHSQGTYDRFRGTHRKNKGKYSINGTSDILGIFKTKFLAIEVKRPSTRKRVTKDQAKFLKEMEKLGAIAFVATSIEDVQKELLGYGVLEKWEIKLYAK